MLSKKGWLRNIGIVMVLVAFAVTFFGCSSSKKEASSPGNQAGKGEEAKPVTLMALTSWPKDSFLVKPFFMLKEEVEKQSKGNIKIEWKGGPEAVKQSEQAQVVGKGAADLTFTTAAYYTSQIPEAKILDFSTISPEVERSSGALDYLSDIMDKKLGVKFLGRGNSGRQYAFYTTKPVSSSSDLKGLQLRGNPTYLPAINAVGAKMVNIPTGDTYNAIERGVVDGTCYPNVDLISEGLHEVLKYKIKPFFWQSGSGFLMNSKKWNSLSKSQQDIIIKAIQTVEAQYKQVFSDEIQSEDKKIQEAGMKIVTLSDADEFAKKVNDAALQTLEKVLGPDEAKELAKRFIK